jgi:predicted Rossmann-fold nucleotide-binding protein
MVSSPCRAALARSKSYFNHLLAFLDHTQAEGFLHVQHRSMLLVANTPAELLTRFSDYAPPKVDKWRVEPS